MKQRVVYLGLCTNVLYLLHYGNHWRDGAASGNNCTIEKESTDNWCTRELSSTD